MSLFNFNPSGFLGSGAFTLDPSKFNFSNISYSAPKPVDDPVAIVSDKTPDTEVEILEGAGTVTVTEKTPDPDPIEEAIQTVQPKYSPLVEQAISQTPTVTPTVSTPVETKPVETAVTGGYKPTTPVTPQPEVKYSPAVQDAIAATPDPVEQAIQSVMPQVSTPVVAPEVPASVLSGGVVGDMSTLLPSAVETLEQDVKDTGDLIGQAEQQAFGDFTFNIVQDSELAGQDKQLFSGEEREQVFSQASENFDEAKNKLIEAYEAQGLDPSSITDSQVLSGLGLPNLMYSDDPEDNMDLLWQWDSESQEFKKIDRRPDELKEAATNIAVGLGMAAMTGGIASSIGAIAGGAGATAGTAKAIGNVVANTVVQGVTTGSVDPKDLAVAAINGYADGVQQAVKTGEVTKELAAQADLIKDISTSVDLVKAVEDKDVLGAISSGLELADLDSPASYIKDTFGTTDAQTKGILKVADKQLQGENLEDSIKSGLTEWVKEGGLSEIELSGSFELPDINIEIPEELKEIGDALANGASELNRNVIKPLVKTVEGIGTQIKDTYKEEIEPYIEREFDDFKDYYKTEIEPSIEQGINDVKQELADFDDSTLQPAKDTIIKTAENIENYYKTEIEPSIEQGIKDVKEELARFDENVLQPIKNTAEQVLESVDEKLGQFDDEVLQPIKDDIIAVAESVDQGLSDFNKDVIKPAMQSIEDRLSAIDTDTSDLEKMIKGLFEMVNFGNVANQTMQRVANRPTFEQVDLTNVELLTPEVVEGFEYDNLSNKLLA